MRVWGASDRVADALLEELGIGEEERRVPTDDDAAPNGSIEVPTAQLISQVASSTSARPARSLRGT